MKHFPHPLCNSKLFAAVGTEEDVDTLHIQRGTVDGFHCIRSFWTPTPEELRALNAGGCVVLTVLGTSAPPVKLNALPPDEGVPDNVFKHDEKLLDELMCDGKARMWSSSEVLREYVHGVAKTYAMQMLRRHGS